MFYRAIVAVIILFWAFMTTRLVRTELFSGDGSSMPVPVDFVTKLMFQHEQASDLALYSQGRRLDGSLLLRPKRLPGGADGHGAPLNLLNITGNFAVNLPGVNIRRVTLRGSVELTDQQQFRRLDLTASLHEVKQVGSGITLLLEGSPANDDWHYVIRQAGTIIREDAGPMARLLAAADPHLPGLSLGGIEQMQRQQATTTRVTAHRGSLRLGGDSVETYVLSFTQAGTEAATIHFGQLGQVLAVKTFAGYDFYDEGMAP